jgi:TRAP-type C4-dicarboxylate transport system permease small subunit
MKKIIDIYYSFLKMILTILMGLIIVPVTMQIFARYWVGRYYKHLS